MPSIKIDNVSLDYPVYGVSGRELRNQLLTAATGGLIRIADNNTLNVRALNNVQLQINAGDRIGIRGHNGSGKTSLLRVMAGIVAPTQGSVTVVGHVLPLINIGIGAHPDLTGLELVRLRLRLDGYRADKISLLEKEIIDFAELGQGFSNLPIRSYSSGMVARLLFSIVTIQRPDILLLDEWLSVADQSFIEKAEQRMHQLMHETGIVVMASHNMDLLRRWCPTIYEINQGSLQLVDMPSELSNPQ